MDPEYSRLHPNDRMEDKLLALVISFGNARRMKAIKLKREGIFCFEIWFSPASQGTGRKFWCLKQGVSTSTEIYPAYTVSELVEIVNNDPVIGQHVLDSILSGKTDLNLSSPDWWAERIIEIKEVSNVQ